MRRMRFFASRNAREILRDPISVGFGVVFPILLLLLLILQHLLQMDLLLNLKHLHHSQVIM